MKSPTTQAQKSREPRVTADESIPFHVQSAELRAHVYQVPRPWHRSKGHACGNSSKPCNHLTKQFKDEVKLLPGGVTARGLVMS